MQRPVSSFKTLSEEYCGKNNYDDSDQQGGGFMKQRNGYVVFIQTYIFVWDFQSEKYERKHNINQMSITMNKEQANKKTKKIKLKCGMSGHNSPQLWSLGAKTLKLCETDPSTP